MAAIARAWHRARSPSLALQALAMSLFLALASCESEGTAPEGSPVLPVLSLEGVPEPARSRLAQARRMAEEDPTSADATGRLGMHLHANLRFDEARQCFERAVHLAPGSHRWNYYLAAAHTRAGQLEDAAESYERALAIDPSYAPARLGHAHSLLESGNSGGALKAYRALLEIGQARASALFGIGRALLALGETGPAVEHLEEACQLFPGFGAAHYALAQAYQATGLDGKAASHLEMYRRSPAGAPPVEDPLLEEVLELSGGFGHMRRGVELTAANRLEEAESEFLEAVKDPAVALGAHSNLILVYTRLQRFAEAERHYDEAIALDPRSEDVHFNHGVALALRGQHAEAAGAFEAALEINPLNAEGQMNLGYVRELLGDEAEAEARYRSILDLEPSHPGANFRLGRLVLHRGDTVEAIPLFQASLATEGEHTLQALYGLATAQAIAGELPDAVRTAKSGLDRARQEGRADLEALIRRDIQAWTNHQPR